MNHDVEDILTKQSLRKPGPELDARVLSALRGDAAGADGTAGAGWRVTAGWWLAAAAAVAVVAFVLHLDGPGRTPAPDGTASGAPVVEATPAPDRANAEPHTRDVPPPAIACTGGAIPEPATVAGVGWPRIVEATWSEWGAGSVLVLDGNLPVQPVIRRTVRYTRWTDPERNLRIERREPASQVFLVRAPVI